MAKKSRISTLFLENFLTKKKGVGVGVGVEREIFLEAKNGIKVVVAEGKKRPLF